jgi:amino acid adenylation domain-containing protein
MTPPVSRVGSSCSLPRGDFGGAASTGAYAELTLSVSAPRNLDREARVRSSCAALAAVLHRYGARREVAFPIRCAEAPNELAKVDLTGTTWSDLCDGVEVVGQGPETSDWWLADGAALLISQSDRPDSYEPPVLAVHEMRFSVAWGATGLVTVGCRAAAGTTDADCARMAGHLGGAIESLLSDPSTAYGDGVSLTLEEIGLAAALDRPASVSAAPSDLVSRFLACVERSPDAVAVRAEGARLTYSELAGRAAAIAHDLSAAGVVRGDLVGLAASRGADLIAGLVGILLTGAAYVPIDPEYPAARRQVIVEDAAPKAVLVGAGVELEVPSATSVVRLSAASAPVPVATAGRSEPDDIAYVIYTSGSTGRPKGVEVTHRNVTRLFDATAQQVGPGADDVWTMFHSYAFDFSVWEIWGALLHGGCLVVVPFGVSRDPHAFADLVRAESVTVLNQTPSAFTQFVAAAGDVAFPSLRLVMLGGEMVHPRALTGWFDGPHSTATKLANLYGITETTVHVTWHLLDKADTADHGSPIGLPLEDLGVRLVDDQGRTPPALVPGEILVRGDGLAKGYHRAAELTAERFTTDADGVRWYHSGDLATMRLDGRLSYVGRSDRQVKIRGFRIELGDIEAALRLHPLVSDSVVLTVAGPLGKPALAAFTAVAGDGVTETELKGLLRRTLPDHMVPGQVRIISKLPLTPNGKTDTDALRELLSPAQDAVPATARLTGAAAVLADVWTDLLGVRPGPGDTFIDLGGDSLSVIVMLSRAAERGLDLDLAEVFAGRTLAELIDGKAPAETSPVQELTVEAIWADLPATPAEAARALVIHPATASADPPLVMFPWGTGSIELLRHLPAGFDPVRDVIGVESVGMHDNQRPLTEFTDIARYATDGILATGVRSLHLGGFCFGAAVALSVAELLEQAGVEVRSLVLADLAPPDADDPERLWSLDDFLQFHVSMVRNSYGTDDAETLRRLAERGIVDKDEPAERFLPLKALWSANAYALTRWRPPSFAGPVLLAVSEKHRSAATPSAWSPHLNQSLVSLLACHDAPDSRDLLTSPTFTTGLPAYLSSIDAVARVAT